jgi:hypothetical protein
MAATVEVACRPVMPVVGGEVALAIPVPAVVAAAAVGLVPVLA